MTEKPIKKLGIVANPEMDAAKKCAARALEIIGDRAEVLVEERIAPHLSRTGIPIKKLDAEALIIFGGDGTVLWTLQHKRVPLLCINVGHVGFLTEIAAEDMEMGIERLLTGDYTLDTRITLAVKHNGKRLSDCANEAVINTAEIAKIRAFDIEVDGERMAPLRADGIIVATPTGSTCYSMSAGGPILDPRVNAFIIVPIAPFKLSARPVVVPANSEIRITATREGKECILVLDGQTQETVSSRDVLTFSNSESQAQFVRFNKRFYGRVEEKLAV